MDHAVDTNRREDPGWFIRDVWVSVIWTAYPVKYLSESYKFGIIRKIRLQYNHVCIEKIKKKKMSFFCVWNFRDDLG